MIAALFHLVSGNGERVPVNPVPSDLDGFDRAEQRETRPKEEELRALRGLLHFAHDGRKFSPVNRRHRSHDGSRENPRNSVDRIVLDEAGTHGQIHDFARPHQHPLQGGLVAGGFNALDCLDDERSRDFVNLSGSEWTDDVPLQSSFFVHVRDDSPALQVAPKTEGVSQHIPSRRFLPRFLLFPSRNLPGLSQRHLGPVAEHDVGDSAVCG